METTIFVKNKRALYTSFSKNKRAVVFKPEWQYVRVKAYYADNVIRFMKSADSSGKIMLRVGEIAEALAGKVREPITTGTTESKLQPLEIWFETPDGAEYLLKYKEYIIGGERWDDQVADDEFLMQHFLSVRPKKHYTNPLSKEIISFVNIQDAHVTITVSLAGGQTAQQTLWREGGQEDLDKLIDVDVSCVAIAQLCKLTDQTINSYTISLSGRDNIEFVVKENTPSMSFIFLNSLGGWDTIHAYGKITSSQSSDVSTFINNNIEQELSNHSVDYCEVNTGFVETMEEERFWREFFRSSNRYVQRGNTFHRIVVDEYKAEKDGGVLGSFTLKFHLADQSKKMI